MNMNTESGFFEEDIPIFEFEHVLFRGEGIPMNCTVRVFCWEPYLEGRTFGPPENCYPPEGGYGEWEICGPDGLSVDLTDKEMDELEKIIFDIMEDKTLYDEPDDDDEFF